MRYVPVTIYSPILSGGVVPFNYGYSDRVDQLYPAKNQMRLNPAYVILINEVRAERLSRPDDPAVLSVEPFYYVTVDMAHSGSATCTIIIDQESFSRLDSA
jgi:hypothetical protein